MRKSALGIVIATLLALGFSGAVSAQDSQATPTIPTAAECTIEPISFDRLASISATPVASEAAPVEASPVVPALPAGEPADADTTAALQASVTQLVACVNAGDSLRGLALYSDGFISQAFAGVNISQEMYDAETTNLQPRSAGQEVVLISFGDAVILPDGRAAIIVQGDDLSSPDAASGTLFYLVNDESHWLIDETVETPDEGS